MIYDPYNNVITNTTVYPASTLNPGTPVYSLTGNARTFKLGTYNLTDVAYGAGNQYGAYNAGTLVVSTPEPSAFLLLLTGFLATGVVVALKKATV